MNNLEDFIQWRGSNMRIKATRIALFWGSTVAAHAYGL